MKHFTISPNRKKIGIILFWLLLWQLLSLLIANPLFFSGPADTLKALGQLVEEPVFLRSVFTSFGKICCGFFMAFVLSVLLGHAAWFCPLFGDFLSPLMRLTKTVPVASFVLLALVWIGSGNLSVFISFLIVIPILYESVVSGLKSTNPALLEMVTVFRIPFPRKLWYLYRPALFPFLYNGCKIALGMSWKAGIAAEVIGVPSHSIGEGLYLSKIYFDTSGIFAWTLTIILISVFFEKIFLFLLTLVLHPGKKGGTHGNTDKKPM